MSIALLVDTGFSALPILEVLRKLNLKVHVVGSRASDALVAAADVYHHVDYADVAAMKQLMILNDFEYLIPGCTDKSYEVCASIASPSHRGIDSLDQTKIINDKKLFRELLRLLGIPAPRPYDANEFDELAGAVIVKPVDAFSGRGISIIDSGKPHDLPGAIQYARSFSASGQVLIEDFVSGQLYSYSCFIRAGIVSVGFFVREDCERSKFAVDTSSVCWSFPQGVGSKIRDNVESIAKHLGLADGLFHIQFILNQQDYWILEATRRCPGDLYSILIQLSTDFDYAGAYVSAFIGQSALPNTSEGSKRSIIRHTLAGQGAHYLSYWSSGPGMKIVRCYPVAPCGSHWEKDRPNRCAIIFIESDENSEHSVIYHKVSSGALFGAS